MKQGSASEAISRLASYRSAAQFIRREPTRLGVRLSKLIALRGAASGEPDPFVREMASALVYSQASWLLEGEEFLKRIETHDPILRAARRLRQRGLEHCPECQVRLSDPTDWEYWRALRQSQIERLRALDREPELVDPDDQVLGQGAA